MGSQLGRQPWGWLYSEMATILLGVISTFSTISRYRAHAAIADNRFGLSLDDEQPDGLWQQSWPDDRGSKPPPDGIRQVTIVKTGSNQVNSLLAFKNTV